MYIIYNIVQYCAIVLGNSLLVKSQNWLQTQELIASITYNQLCKIIKLIQTINICKDPAVMALANLI